MLHGREAELGRLVALIGDAVAGRAGSVVVSGDAGVGKTLLVTESLAAAGIGCGRTSAATEGEQPLVLRAQGIESEAPLAFAAIHRLLRPLLADLDRLSPRLANALRIAVGQEGEGVVDRLVVFAAIFSLLTGAAESRTLVCVVDDAHWLDSASGDALLFVARRVDADRIALIFTARPGPGRFEASDLDEIELKGLDSAAAQAVVRDHGDRPMTDAVVAELLRLTRGNPLALIELPRGMTSSQLSGRAPIPERMPLTQVVERALLARVRDLPAQAQQFLLVLAADDSRRLRSVRSAGVRLGLSGSSVDAALRSELLEVGGAEYGWSHPLVRSAVYAVASEEARAEAHGALAMSFADEGDVDRCAWHQGLADDQPDDDLAGALETAAENATRRGAHSAASKMSARAAELTTAPDARARRFLAAGWSAWLGGQLDEARAMVAEGLGATRDATLVADLSGLQARLEWNAGSADAGARMLLETSKRMVDLDPARSLETAMVASVLITFGASQPSASSFDHLREVTALAGPRMRCLAHLTAGHQRLVAGSWADAATELRAADALGSQLTDEPDIQSNLALSAFHLGDDDRAEAVYRNLLAGARSDSRLSLMVHALARLPTTQLPAGRWDAATTSISEAINLISAAGQPFMLALPLAWQALMAAARGRRPQEAINRLRRLKTQTPVGIAEPVTDDIIRWARGIENAGDRQPAAAFHHFEQIELPVLQRMSATERIEAAVAAGQRETAARWVADIEHFGRATGAAWARATAELGLALLSEPAEAENHFHSALAWHTGFRRPVDRARTQLAFGSFLRRSGRRVDARVQLDAALLVFDDIGAEPLAARARAELRASGESRNSTGHATSPLTAQENQAAQLAGQGLSNRQIAEQLFLSPRTVEYHLSHVYQKLGISSRGELTRVLARGR